MRHLEVPLGGGLGSRVSQRDLRFGKADTVEDRGYQAMLGLDKPPPKTQSLLGIRGVGKVEPKEAP